MEIEVSEQGPVAVLVIHGSVDSLNAEQLNAAFAARLQAGNARLVADFSDVSYTSSAGLRALLGNVKESRRLGGDLRIAAVQPAVERVLSLSGFTSIIKMYPDTGTAVASFGAPA